MKNFFQKWRDRGKPDISPRYEPPAPAIFDASQLQEPLGLFDELKNTFDARGEISPIPGKNGANNRLDFPSVNTSGGDIFSACKYFAPDTGDYLGFTVERHYNSGLSDKPLEEDRPAMESYNFKPLGNDKWKVKTTVVGDGRVTNLSSGEIIPQSTKTIEDYLRSAQERK